jgi:hypothetical protein
MVPYQHELAPRLFDQGHQEGQVPGRHHGGLVTDHHLAPAEALRAEGSVEEELGQGFRWQPGLLGEHAGSDGGGSHSSDRGTG